MYCLFSRVILIGLLLSGHTTLNAAQWYNEQFASHFVAEVTIGTSGAINRLAVTCDQNNRGYLYLSLVLNNLPKNTTKAASVDSQIEIDQNKFKIQFAHDDLQPPYLRSTSQVSPDLLSALKKGYRLKLYWQEAGTTSIVKADLRNSHRTITSIEDKCYIKQVNKQMTKN